jgi:hypothetical protein
MTASGQFYACALRSKASRHPQSGRPVPRPGHRGARSLRVLIMGSGPWPPLPVAMIYWLPSLPET